MTGASIEETLELWAWSLRDVKARMRPLFTQEGVAGSAGQFLDGPLGEERRKTGWMRAEAAGDRRVGKGYVLGVNANSQFHSWIGKPPVAGTATEIAEDLDPTAWHHVSAGTGTKGERLHDWAYLQLADLEAAECDERLSGFWTRGLLIRRNIADGDLAFFSTWCPAGTTVEALVGGGRRPSMGHRG